MRNAGSGSEEKSLYDFSDSVDDLALADEVRRQKSNGKNGYIIDEQFKQIIPPLQSHEYQFLEESIELRGVLEPITVWKEENIIVDGHNRYEITQRLGKKKCPSKKISFSNRSEALLWIQKHQLERRNITDYTRYELVHGIREQLLEIGKEKRKRKPTHTESVLTENDKTKDDTHNTRNSIATVLGWGSTKVGQADTCYKEASEEAKNTLRNGSVTINSVYSSIKKVPKEEKKKSKTGEYAVLYVDNPADETFEQTLKLPLKETAAENSMLFIWCPVLVLDRLIKKLPSWGFHYRTMFVWEETQDNIQETDGINSIQHELLIVAEKGKLEIEKPCKQSSVLSSKNVKIKRFTKVLKLIENMFPSQKKVLIGAAKREGWENVDLNTSPVLEVTSAPQSASLIEEEEMDKSDGKKKLQKDVI